MEKYVLVVSDTHTGSAYGAAPSTFTTSTGNKIDLNDGQRYLERCWQHMITQIPESIDVLILNGDLCEGQNLSEQSRGLSEVDPMFQARSAAELLKPLTDRAKEIHLIRGSQYHTGKGAFIEEALGQIIGSERHEGTYTTAWLTLLINGVEFDVAHKQSYMMRNRSASLEREISFWLERKAIESMRTRKPVPARAVIVRSHTHVMRLLRTGNILAVGTPAWKLQDEFARLGSSPNRTFPENIGAIGLKVYEKPHGNKQVHVIPYLYDHPR